MKKKILDEISNINLGKHISQKQYIKKDMNTTDENFFVLNVSDIKNNTIIVDNLKQINVDNTFAYQKYLIKKGDLILNSVGKFCKVAIVPEIDNKNIVCHSNLFIIRPKCEILSEYLMLFFQSPTGISELIKIQKGQAFFRISIVDLKNIDVPVLPLEKQKAIVQKIKSLEEQLQNEKNIINKLFESFLNI